MSEAVLTAVEIIKAIFSASLSISDRVAILRALRDSTPGLVAPDPRLRRRIGAARAVPVEYVDSTVVALENSEAWQGATSKPEELRGHRERSDELLPFREESKALTDLLTYNARYQHFLAVEKARAAHKVGREITNEAALSIKPHLDVMAEARPQVGRRKKKAAQPTTTPTPSTTPQK